MIAPCLYYLSPEGCRYGEKCRKRHDIFRCTCNLVIFESDRSAHFTGARHAKLMAHIMSNASRHGVLVEPDDNDDQAVEHRPCPRCRKNVPLTDIAAHEADHARRDHIRAVKEGLQNAEEDKEGITISSLNGFDLGVVELNQTATADIVISKDEGAGRIALQSFFIRSHCFTNQRSNTEYSLKLGGHGRWIKPSSPLIVTLSFTPSTEGQVGDVAEFVFHHTNKRKHFVITRKVTATAGSIEDHQALQPSAPYHRKPLTRERLDGRVIRSLRPPAWTPTKWRDKLPQNYPPTKLIYDAYGYDPEKQRKHFQSCINSTKLYLPPIFSIQTYQQHYKVLLWLEEEQMRLDLETYALTDVELIAKHPRYQLAVEGLSEGRPSVLIGDFIHLRRNGDDKWYEGRVHDILLDRVTLAMPSDFSLYRGTKFDARFVLNRLTLRRMHFALEYKEKPPRLLFPEAQHANHLHAVSSYDPIRPINRQLAANPQQMNAVRSIVNLPQGSIPFIVFGPPGTGKSVTICEAILQLLDSDPSIKILACAPSNSAADLLAQRLKQFDGKLKPDKLFRLNSMTRKVADLPVDLTDYSLINDNKLFAMPTLDQVEQYRIIVATCHSGGVPANLGVKRGHFSHIFVDEAGQATEPETMVPILSHANNKTNVILAGDNQQLRPVIQSPIARALGFNTSYLMRMMDRPVYDLAQYSGRTIVKLVKNFRSHPDILRFSNERFYGNELQACGRPELIRSMEMAEELPCKKFPLVFHAVHGKDDQEKSSPSFFNIDEASVVKSYCASIVNNRKNRIPASDIGVITPYHAQRCKIMHLLSRDTRLAGIKVGSVEEFQGQERRVIIVSTVRSNTAFMAGDIRRTLGFVANPRRFNVTVTRAQAMLVVIGNPDILSLDPFWRAFIQYVHERGGWKGKKGLWEPEESQDESCDDRRNLVHDQDEQALERLKSMIMQANDGGPWVEPEFSDEDD